MVVIVVPVVAAAVAAVMVLSRVLDVSTSTGRLEMIRTALAIGAGTGAVMTLVLAWRRQWSTEHDAGERRLTELYVKAVEQLGSDKAAVRHGALYALERVAQDNPSHRQTVVDVLCAYLRAPFTPPPDKAGSRRLSGLRAPLRPARTRPAAPLSATSPREVEQEQRQEREVRLTAQRILTRHLRRTNRTFWPNIDLDLTDATLNGFDMDHCHVRSARFGGATFIGTSTFFGVTFDGFVDFRATRFIGAALFYRATFASHAWFNDATFNAMAWFDATRFGGKVSFRSANFCREANFQQVRFTGKGWSGVVDFTKASFAGRVNFDNSRFSDDPWPAKLGLPDRFRLGPIMPLIKFEETRFAQGVPPQVAPLLTPSPDEDPFK
ncbi:uncharacterized protein YjbI with pentapeptide repeats [Actinokineospora baliensis]|uniref:pentapeptide repeat-containing protein n=1 Tax=Actinokineospora baliensis TaxID=547056 RepID=UPI00195838E5|nr:pentapeptide repeat-containing protein [Actinokineospora baliensis]MBM7774394.1 uncharacterized protein YjbI with pentapeptide repeats [Actinokineospora baliensis]